MAGKCKFLKEFDIFAKEPKLYFKGKEKKTTWYGSIFTICYLIIYFAFFIYKFWRMLKKKDVTFYDSFEYLEGPPQIHLTKDKFFGGFALEHPITNDQFVDETIYYPKAYFKTQTRDGENWNIEEKELELVRCKPELFGEDFQDSLIDSIENLYCFKEMDQILQGSFSYDIYSYFEIFFYPCKNSTENNNHCRTREELDFYLMNTYVCFELEDVQLTPNNYKKPTRGRNNDIYYTVGKKLFQEVHIFFQLVHIQTDLDIIGFDEFPNIKEEKFIKYDWDYQMSSLLDNDIYDTGNAFCSAQIKLDDEVRIQTRTYYKIMTLLGDVGGFMEFILSVFKIVSSFTIDIQYDTSLVNNLFEFNLSKKVISFKNRLEKKNIFESLYNEQNTLRNTPTKMDTKGNKNTIHIYDYEKNALQSKSRLNDNQNLNKLTMNELQPKKKKHKKKKKNNSKTDNNKLEDNNKFNNNINKDLKNKNEEKDKSMIISKIKHNKCLIYFGLIFARRKRNMMNILLDEGIDIFSQKMDIMRLFKLLYKGEEKMDESITISMSDNCKSGLGF